MAEGRAKVIEEAGHAHDERKLQEYIRDNKAYRDLKVKTTVESGLADSAKKIVDAQGSLALKKAIEQNPDLTAQAIQTVRFEKQAAEYETIVQKAAEAAYDNYSRTNNGARDLRLRAIESTDTSAATEKEWNAYVDELRTVEGAQQRGMANSPVVQRLQQAVERQRVETQRAGAAKRLADVEYAKRVMDTSTNLAVEAGGIEGEAGVSQAKAVAFQTIVDAQNKGTAAEKTLLSRVTEDDLLGSEYLGSNNVLDMPTEKISAIGGTIAGRMHQMSHIKLWERMGELQRQAKQELNNATSQEETKAAEEKLDKVKDLQQQVMGDKQRTPFGAGDTDQGAAKVGQYEGNIYESTRARISTHMSAKRLSEMDPDDIRLLFEMAREGKLSRDEVKIIADAYDEWENDDILGTSLEPKHRRLLDPIKNDRDGSQNYPQGSNQPGDFWNGKYDLRSLRNR